jgi:hypothetical protein
LFANAAEDNRTPVIFYLHPWEIDPDQPRVPGASLLSRFRHYNNLERCLPRLKKLIGAFPFGTVSESLRNIEPQAIERVQLEAR